MSLKKRSTRRLGLLAGSSLVAASISAATFGGVVLTPAAALAYDECTPTPATGTLGDGTNGLSDPTLNGGAADSFTCTAATYATGITYTAAGDLAVSRTGAISVTANGVNLLATGNDSIRWTSTAGLTPGAGTNGPALDIKTDSGAINVTTQLLTATQPGTTYGMHLVSGDATAAIIGGDISVTHGGGGPNNNVAGGLAAIKASTNGGDISINFLGSGLVQGSQRVLVAETNGAGSVTISAGSILASAADGIGIDIVAGTGGVSLATRSTVTAGSGLAIRAVTTGGMVYTHSGGTLSGALDFQGVAGGVTFTLTSASSTHRWSATGSSIFGAGNDVLNVPVGDLASGASISLGAGNDSFATTVYAASDGTIDLGSGADTFIAGGLPEGFGVTGTVLNGTMISMGAGADRLHASGMFKLTAATVDFGGEDDVFDLEGNVIATDSAFTFGAGNDSLDLTGRFTAVGDTSITGIETFTHSGVIYMGGQGAEASNMIPGDVLTVSGGTFTGAGGKVIMDVAFAGGGQTDCSAATVADCLVFTEATTEGATLLTLVNADGSSFAGSSSRTTLVMGSTQADAFVLDPDTPGAFETDQGTALRKRLFDLYLLYDEAAQQHVLAAAAHVEAFQIATYAAAAQDLWRTTTGSWFDRQADLRATPGGLESGRGLWARAGVSVADRDVVVPLELLGTAFDTEVSYSQRISHAVFGLDVLGAAMQDSAWVLGVNGGFVRSDAEFEVGSGETVYAGFMGGLYGAWIAGPFFLDATANANHLRVNTDMPGLALESDIQLKQKITSVGGQLQAGWRFGFGEGLFAEPLASVSYVQTRIDEIEVPGQGGEIGFDDATSLRAGVGLRGGMDSVLMGLPANLSLTGRYWNEMEGENAAVLAGNAPSLLVDNYAGDFGEVVASLNLFTDGGGVSGFLNLGGKFAEGYQSIDSAIGVRMRW